MKNEISKETRSEAKRRIIEAVSSGLKVSEALEVLNITTNQFVDYKKTDPEFAETIAALTARILPTEATESRLKRLFERGEGDASRYVKTISTPKEAAEIAEKMGDALSRGLTFEQACIYVSVSPIEVRRYAESHPEFFTALNESEMQFSMYLIDKIMRHAGDNWKAAAWLLERKYPEKWGETKSVDVKQRAAIEKTTQIRDQSQMTGAVMTIDIEKMSDEDLKRALEASK